MATTLTRNLRLRVNSNLTADARYNLERIDALGSTFLVDTSDNLQIRSDADIYIEPNSADLGGSGIGGNLFLGNPSHSLEAVKLYADLFQISAPLSILDQATGGNKYLNISYKSDLEGAVDTAADRDLEIDVAGASRQLVLGGSLTITGFDIELEATGPTSVILPETGTLATLSGTETLTNKTIDSDGPNTFLNIRNASIAANAAILYSKLSLADSIVNADINSAAAIAYSKLALSGSIVNTDVSNSAAIAYSKLNLATSILNTDISDSAAIEYHKLQLSGTIQETDLDAGFSLDYSQLDLTGQIQNSDIQPGAGIQYSKLQLSGSVVDADISNSADIAYSKLALSGAIQVNDLDAVAPTPGQILSSPDGLTYEWITAGGTGTVTSVGLDLPGSVFDIVVSPITTSGNLTADFTDQGQNQVFAGPATGGAGEPDFRLLVAADIPQIDHGTLAGLGDDDHIQYHNDSRALTWLGTRSTSDLPEGSNFYYTDSRFDTRFALKTTTDLAEGTNLYYTSARFNSAFATKSTTDLSEGSNLYFTDERARDAVGAMLTDTASVDLTYDDSNDTVQAAVIPAGVNHNALQNYVANEHVDHTSVSINTASNSGLSGGGTIAASRSLVIDPTNAPAVTVASDDIVLIADASNSNVLSKTTAGAIAALAAFTLSSFKATWLAADGASKVVTHNLNSTDVIIQLFDTVTGESIEIDSPVRTDVNTVTLTASQAPDTSWRVLILAI